MSFYSIDSRGSRYSMNDDVESRQYKNTSNQDDDDDDDDYDEAGVQVSKDDKETGWEVGINRWQQNTWVPCKGMLLYRRFHFQILIHIDLNFVF